MAAKRSLSSSDSPPHHKAPRSDVEKPPQELVCSLPPTCNKGHGTTLFGTRELEIHYAKYHAHVCEVGGCECVFPDVRMLELHFIECHDPLSEVRKERGEKIFACHLASCGQYFRTPKNRRLHLIQAHGYPKEYFFAITNKGIGGLLRKWGEGASLVRGTWQARETTPAIADSESDTEDKAGDDMDEDEGPSKAKSGTSISEQMRPTRGPPHAAAPALNGASGPSNAQRNGVSHSTVPLKSSSADIDALAGTMSSLSLVPSSVRFGRGAKSSGHIGRHSQAHTQPVASTPSNTQTIASPISSSSHIQANAPSTPQHPARLKPQPQAQSPPATQAASHVANDAKPEPMDQVANAQFLRGRGQTRVRGNPRVRGGPARGGGFGSPRAIHRGMMYRGGRGRGAAMHSG